MNIDELRENKTKALSKLSKEGVSVRQVATLLYDDDTETAQSRVRALISKLRKKKLSSLLRRQQTRVQPQPQLLEPQPQLLEPQPQLLEPQPQLLEPQPQPGNQADELKRDDSIIVGEDDIIEEIFICNGGATIPRI